MPKSALSLAPASGIEEFKIPKKKKANTKKRAGGKTKKSTTTKSKSCPCKNGYDACAMKHCKNKVQKSFYESFAAPSSMPVSVTFGGTEEFKITRSRMRSGAPKRKGVLSREARNKLVTNYMKKHLGHLKHISKVTGKMVYPKDAMIKASKAVAAGKQ
jgi:hypothetical protein